MSSSAEEQEARAQRVQIAERIRAARSRSNQGLKVLAEKIGVSDSLFSMYEAARRPLPAEHLPRLCRELDVDPEHLLGMTDREARPTHPFEDARRFLDQVLGLGVEAIYPDRGRALFHLCPMLERVRKGQMLVTGSSLKGLHQDNDHEFLKILIQQTRRGAISMRVVMTHPLYGSSREELERRSAGSIVDEVFAGTRFLTQVLKVPTGAIKFMRAPPTCFSIFLEDGHQGLALINPYPLMRQAFSSVSTIVRQLNEPGGGRTHSVYSAYRIANFVDVWEHQTVVDWQTMIDQCKGATPDSAHIPLPASVLNALKRGAAALEDSAASANHI